MPALPPYIIEPIFEQFLALLADRVVHHPLGCHKPPIPERVILEKLVSDFGVRLRLSPDRRGRVFGHRDSGPTRGVDRTWGDGGAQANSALGLRSIHRS